MSKAFYAGTFNPFTIGHKSIVDRALRIFDEVIIGVGYNIHKASAAVDAAARAAEIAKLYSSEPRVSVVSYGGLTTDIASEYVANVLIRGVRSSSDFEYERNIAEVNRRISGLETMLMFSLPEHDCISSSMVRELSAFGADTSPFLPH